ncbi:MAG: hypothetical protein Q9173_006352 [Seirophora scorigena]
MQPLWPALENAVERSWSRSPSPAGNSEMKDPIGYNEPRPCPDAVDQHSSFSAQYSNVDLVANLSPSLLLSQPENLRKDSWRSPLDSSNPSRESSLSEPRALNKEATPDPAQHHPSTYDWMIVPKKHRRLSRESSQFSAKDIAALPPSNRRTRRIGVFENAASTRSHSQTTLNSSPFMINHSPHETDIDEPMPRLLPKFSAKSWLDWTEAEESNAEDEKEDVITKEELRTWLRSQAGRDSAFDIFGVSFSPSTKVKVKPRNLPIEYPFGALESYTYNGVLLRRGVNIELQDIAFVREIGGDGGRKQPHNSFMRIVNIIQDCRSQAITLRGWVFQRAQYLDGILEKKRNEVCWVMHVDEDDCRDTQTQSMETVPVEIVVRCRDIRLTNQPFPKLSFREEEGILEDSEDAIRNDRTLVCRFMYICYYVSAERRETNHWSERSLQRLPLADCDNRVGPTGEPCAMNDKELRRAWRGQAIPGGASPVNQQTEGWHERVVEHARRKTVDLTSGISKQDPEIALPASTERDHQQPIQITDIATRVNRTTAGSTEHYKTNGCTPPKRPAHTDLTSRSFKRHQHEPFSVRVERPPLTVSMVAQLKRKSTVVDTAPWESLPRFTEPPIQDTWSINIHNTRLRATKRQYTFGDAFCGAGGMSRAAYQAGLHLKFAFDCNKNACNTYAMNFPKVDLHCLWAHDFVQQETDCKVDIAHFSPPCQFFSPAHTIAGKDDEMNTASLFAVGDILKKSKPRVVTLEQTFGLVLRQKHQGYLNALLQIFTSHGFSIRWRLLHCADYGLPQMRLRTFMIASWYLYPSFPPILFFIIPFPITP